MGNITNKSENNNTNSKLSINCLDIITRHETLHQFVKNFWETEDYLSTNSREVTVSQEDKRCLSSLIEQAKLVEGKYQVPMLWKKGNQKRPNNYEAALRRLKPLQRRLQRNRELFNKYKQTIDNYIKQIYSSKSTEEKREKASNRTWYLPHHPCVEP